jgi:predicted PurR-regulated permease PerM
VKLVIALIMVIVVCALLVRFNMVIVPVLIALVLAYLLHPLVTRLGQKLHFTWGLVVNLIYLVILVILLALLAWGGLGLINQVQNLIGAILNYTNQLPGFINNLPRTVLTLGPFHFDFSNIVWQAVGSQMLGTVEDALGNLGGLIGKLATSAASILGSTAFVLLVSYFFLLESGGLRREILPFNIPGYTQDIEKIMKRLGGIWNAYLRGQLIIFLARVIVYAFFMSLWGLHFAVGLALIAGFASFLPYIGPLINWLTLGLVAYFQNGNPLRLSPTIYMVLIVGTALLIDGTFDNLVAPRLMAQRLRVHPALVLITALIGFNLIGLLGVVLAAPLLATLQLAGRYTLRKLLDQDPWPAGEEEQNLASPPQWLLRLRSWLGQKRTRHQAASNGKDHED